MKTLYELFALGDDITIDGATPEVMKRIGRVTELSGRKRELVTDLTRVARVSESLRTEVNGLLDVLTEAELDTMYYFAKNNGKLSTEALTALDEAQDRVGAILDSVADHLKNSGIGNCLIVEGKKLDKTYMTTLQESVGNTSTFFGQMHSAMDGLKSSMSQFTKLASKE